MTEHVYYWGQNEGMTWGLILLSPQVALEHVFPTQLDARKNCMGLPIWRREITDDGFGSPESIKI